MMTVVCQLLNLRRPVFSRAVSCVALCAGAVLVWQGFSGNRDRPARLTAECPGLHTPQIMLRLESGEATVMVSRNAIVMRKRSNP